MKSPNSYVKTKLVPPQSFFDWCYSQIHTYKWQNKQETIEASQRTNCPVITKRLSTRTNLTFFDKFYSFAIILVTKKRIEIQSYAFYSSITDGRQTIEKNLSNFEQFACNKHVKITKLYGPNYVFGLSPVYSGMYNGMYTHTKFFQNNWREKTKTLSELKYLAFDYLEYEDISNIYKYRQQIEFLQKINARILATDVMYPKYKYNRITRGFNKTVDMRIINQNWLKKHKKTFQDSDLGFAEFEFERRIRARRGYIVPGIEKYLTYHDISIIPKKARMINFQNWILKNNINFRFYTDYLNILKELGIVPNTDNLITPKDFTEAHDNYTQILNMIKQERLEQRKIQQEKDLEQARIQEANKVAEQNKQYLTQVKNLLKFETVIGDYAFVVPKELNDIILEGINLNHCVGNKTYLDNHRTGKSTIIFIRKKDARTTSLATMEFSNSEIIQLQGYENNKDIPLPVEIKEASQQWLEWVNTGTAMKKIA